MTRVRGFDHLREVARPLVEEQRSDEVAATASVEPFDADVLWGGRREGGVGAGDVVLLHWQHTHRIIVVFLDAGMG